MGRLLPLLLHLALTSAVIICNAVAEPAGTGFTVQSMIRDQDGNALNGFYDFQASLWDSQGTGNPPTGGIQIGQTETLLNQQLSGGVVTLTLNSTGLFGDHAFDGEARWLELAIRPFATGDYESFDVRQRVQSVPYSRMVTNEDALRYWAHNEAQGIRYTGGNVGIGTDAPQSKLHIGGTAGADGITFPDDTLQTTASPWKKGSSGIFLEDGDVCIGGMGLGDAPFAVHTQDQNRPAFLTMGSGQWATDTDALVLGQWDSGSAALRPWYIVDEDLNVVRWGVPQGKGLQIGTWDEPQANFTPRLSIDPISGKVILSAGIEAVSFKGDGSQLTNLPSSPWNQDGGGVWIDQDVRIGNSSITGNRVTITSDDDATTLSIGNNKTTGSTYAVTIDMSNTSGSALAATAAATSGNTIAGDFRNFSSQGVGVQSYMPSTTGNTVAVSGFNNSITGTSMAGVSLSGNGVNYGLFGQNNSSEPGAAAVFGNSTNPNGGANAITGLANGETSSAVYGQANHSTGTNYGGFFTTLSSNGTAVYGLAQEGTGVNVGVYGQTNSPNGLAGRFKGSVLIQGDLEVIGTVSKSGGSFKIDHPLDPESKYLLHSFVESPEMMNVYNGNVTLNADGRAVVELPAYFEALNGNFRYQLTPIGAPAPELHVALRIKGNRFEIAGGKPGMEVSWQVTGTRQDTFAKENPFIVEREKTASERGGLAMRPPQPVPAPPIMTAPAVAD